MLILSHSGNDVDGRRPKSPSALSAGRVKSDGLFKFWCSHGLLTDTIPQLSSIFPLKSKLKSLFSSTQPENSLDSLVMSEAMKTQGKRHKQIGTPNSLRLFPGSSRPAINTVQWQMFRVALPN